MGTVRLGRPVPSDKERLLLRRNARGVTGGVIAVESSESFSMVGSGKAAVAGLAEDGAFSRDAFPAIPLTGSSAGEGVSGPDRDSCRGRGVLSPLPSGYTIGAKAVGAVYPTGSMMH